jgi:hypothetical protein
MLMVGDRACHEGDMQHRKRAHALASTSSRRFSTLDRARWVGARVSPHVILVVTIWALETHELPNEDCGRAQEREETDPV